MERVISLLVVIVSTISFTLIARAELEPTPAPASEKVHSLASGETISFYTRVAPDQTSIGFTRTRERAYRYAPTILDLRSHSARPLVGSQYDPTYSPDYNLQGRRGFLFGARGDSASFAKYFSFYLPGDFSRPRRELYFSNISGYATVARLVDESILPNVLRPYVGHYLVMGKRWRWFILEVLKNSSGESFDFRQLHPSSGTLALPPFCPELGVGFDKSDSMLSPRGRYISAKRTDRNKVPAIIRTRDCAVIGTPALNGLYGGKATFSNDERFIAFHAFGVDGRTRVVDQITNDGLIKKWADRGLVSNVFVYDISTGRLARLTENHSGRTAVNFFPNFSGDGSWVYYHRHEPGAPSTEIFRVRNPLRSSSESEPQE